MTIRTRLERLELGKTRNDGVTLELLVWASYVDPADLDSDLVRRINESRLGRLIAASYRSGGGRAEATH